MGREAQEGLHPKLRALENPAWSRRARYNK
jgi:hypothetical protein